jgi:hypothetical protein
VPEIYARRVQVRKGKEVNDIIDFAAELLKTPPDDLDRRLAEVTPEMLRRLARNIVIQYQNLKTVARNHRKEKDKLQFYTEKLENLMMRAIGPDALNEE